MIDNWNTFCKEEIKDKLNKDLDKLYNTYSIRPKRENLFKAFELCPEDELKLVVLGHSPYSSYHADGIAFSSCIGWETPISLQIIYNAIKESVYKDKSTNFDEVADFTLKYKDSGILWLNRQLTTKDKITQDIMSKNIWNDFIISLIKYIATNHKNVMWLILTKESKDVYEYLRKKDIKALLLSHPASSIYNNTKWEYYDCFNQINNYLKSINKTEIVW